MLYFFFLKKVADQTPTPTTRLIRNCEEFGLFDDLKHVNPFEETFRQAIDGQTKPSKGSLVTQKSLELIKCNDDETLHTPIPLHTRKYTTNGDKEKQTPNDSPAQPIQLPKVGQKTAVKKKPIRPNAAADTQQTVEIIRQKAFRKIHPKPLSTAGNITNPIKEKIRQSLLRYQTLHSDKNATVDSASKPTVNVPRVEQKPKSIKPKTTNQLRDSKANERNREAAKRYRNKQRVLHDKLLTRNAQLEAEIVQLRHELEMFKKAHEKCSVTTWNTKVLRKSADVPKD